ncbi:MAG TPA: energy transducer TonB [Pyrinomonadaceae bacterium]
MISIILFSLILSAVSAQEVRLPVVRQNSQQRHRPPGIPEAELTTSPEEQKWWNELRSAGEEIRLRKGGDKAKKRFAELLKEGQQKSYAPPVNESRVVFLQKSEPRYTEEARRRRIGGYITLRVEFLPDGTVGDIKPLQSLGAGLDESAIEAARKCTFLPAIKDRKFVASWLPIAMSFYIY